MKVIGHRGAITDGVTENTISAFKLAKETGMDGVEMDLWLTKDKQIVVHHDENLSRIYGIDMNIPEHDFSDLATATKNHKHPLVNLREVLDFLDGFPCVLEIKSKGVGKYLEKYTAESRHQILAVISFNKSFLEEYQKHGGKAKVGFIPTKKNFVQSLVIAKRIGAEIICPNVLSRYTPPLIHLFRLFKLELYVYPINNKKMNDLFKNSYRAEYLVGDDPGDLISFNS